MDKPIKMNKGQCNQSVMATAENNQSEKTCDVHSQRICQMFCLNCKIPVCLSCIAAEHRGHDFREYSPEQKSPDIKDQTSAMTKDQKTTRNKGTKLP